LGHDGQSKHCFTHSHSPSFLFYRRHPNGLLPLTLPTRMANHSGVRCSISSASLLVRRRRKRSHIEPIGSLPCHSRRIDRHIGKTVWAFISSIWFISE